MRATIRRFHSPDVYDLPSWLPPDPECFGFLLQVMIGPEGTEGEDSFNFVVCTPSWLLEQHGQDAVVFGRHHVLMMEYDFERLRQTISRLVERTLGDDWCSIAERIARYGHWEFEDYSD